MAVITETGLAGLLGDDAPELVARTSEGRTLRLQPQGQMSRTAMETLAGNPPEDLPDVVGLFNERLPSSPHDYALSGGLRFDPITGETFNPMNDPEQSSNVNNLIHQARGGSRVAHKQLQSLQQAEQAQNILRARDVEEQREQQRRAFKGEDASITSFVRHHNLGPQVELQARMQLAEKYPLAEGVPSVADLSPVIAAAKSEDVRLSRMEEIMPDVLADEPDAISEYSRLLTQGGERGQQDALDFQKAQMQRQKDKREANSEKYKIGYKQLVQDNLISMDLETVHDTWLPFDERVETETVEYTAFESNPFKPSDPNHSKFEAKQKAAKRIIEQRDIELRKELFGGDAIPETPDAPKKRALERAEKDQEAGVTPVIPEGAQIPQGARVISSLEEGQEALARGEVQSHEVVYYPFGDSVWMYEQGVDGQLHRIGKLEQ